jgi:hypothetical protein
LPVFVFLVGLLSGVSTLGQFPDIVSAEYYIDSDPGPGNGTTLSISSGGDDDEENVSLKINVPGPDLETLSVGTHLITVRFLNADGKWSVAFSRYFEKIPEDPITTPLIVSAEYYIDVDPGVGNGIPIIIPAPVNRAEFSVNVPPSVIDQLGLGIHWITCRTLDSMGTWSIAFSRAFEKVESPASDIPNIAAIEYRWYLEGVPVGDPVQLTPEQVSSKASIQAVASIDGLVEGMNYQLVVTPIDDLGQRGFSETVQVNLQITDSDGDGLPDSWENVYGLDSGIASDNELDLDGDGLSNYQEFVNGTDPRKSDTSGDGINDRLAIKLGLNPLSAYPSIASALDELIEENSLTTEDQVRALYPGKPILALDEKTGLFNLRIGVNETADLSQWQKMWIEAENIHFENGEIVFSFSAVEAVRFYIIESGNY